MPGKKEELDFVKREHDRISKNSDRIYRNLKAIDLSRGAHRQPPKQGSRASTRNQTNTQGKQTIMEEPGNEKKGANSHVTTTDTDNDPYDLANDEEIKEILGKLRLEGVEDTTKDHPHKGHDGHDQDNHRSRTTSRRRTSSHREKTSSSSKRVASTSPRRKSTNRNERTSPRRQSHIVERKSIGPSKKREQHEKSKLSITRPTKASTGQSVPSRRQSHSQSHRHSHRHRHRHRHSRRQSRGLERKAAGQKEDGKHEPEQAKTERESSRRPNDNSKLKTSGSDARTRSPEHRNEKKTDPKPAYAGLDIKPSRSSSRRSSLEHGKEEKPDTGTEPPGDLLEDVSKPKLLTKQGTSDTDPTDVESGSSLSESVDAGASGKPIEEHRHSWKRFVLVTLVAVLVLGVTGTFMPMVIEKFEGEEDHTDMILALTGALGSSTPTGTPSGVPSVTPSLSLMPSPGPSSQPSISSPPSLNPTVTSVPSISPTQSPTVSAAPSVSFPPSSGPTYLPIDPDWSFKLRLSWEKGHFWQEETAERYYCAECVRCDEIGRGDGWEHGCRAYDDKNECREGDALWIRDCRSRGVKFNVLQSQTSGYVLRINNSRNLCVSRIDGRKLYVTKCNVEDEDQLWAPWSDFSKFELRPYHEIGWGEREADCISQLHHPKDDEVLSMHNCRLSRIYETRYWNEY